MISCASISLTLLISVQVNFFTTRGYDPATGELTSVSDHLANTRAYFYHPATHKNAGQISEIRNAALKSRRLTRETGDLFTTRIRKTFPEKASARDYETRLIERFRRMYGENSLPGNKTNR